MFLGAGSPSFGPVTFKSTIFRVNSSCLVFEDDCELVFLFISFNNGSNRCSLLKSMVDESFCVLFFLIVVKFISPTFPTTGSNLTPVPLLFRNLSEVIVPFSENDVFRTSSN